MTRRTTAARFVLAALLAFALPAASAAPAQAPPTEQELLARMSRQPSEVANYLDLAKLYAGAQRYAEAEDMLARATALVRGIRAAQAPAGAQAPTAAPRSAVAPASVEQDLLARVSASPNSVGNYLELARLYNDNQRQTEATQMLTRATELVRRARLGPNAPGAQQALRVGGDIAEPRKIADVKPVYPAEAQAAKVSGIVIIEAVIDTTGGVRDAKVLRSVPLLDQAALDAVKQWRFTPTLLNGTPVEVVMTVTVNFTYSGK